MALCFKPRLARTALCARVPRARMTLRFFINAISETKKGRQFVASAPTGLFSGGTQRTAFVIRVSIRVSPSSALAS